VIRPRCDPSGRRSLAAPRPAPAQIEVRPCLGNEKDRGAISFIRKFFKRDRITFTSNE
ncbi:hypothetical protein EVAR_100054_1, partial [Eumeta japonica]